MQRFGDHHVISGVGVDRAGDKHVLGIEIGAIENAAAAKKRLVGLREPGVRTDQQYLFVIDGAKALRASIEEVFGGEQPVQRCRNHEMRNVMDELPRDQHAQVRDVMRAAWKLTRRRQGIKKLEGLARFLEHEYESAAQLARGDAGDVHDSKAEAAAVVIHMPRNNQRHRESAERGPETTGDVTRWRDAAIVERWVASASVRTENHFPKVIGHEHL